MVGEIESERGVFELYRTPLVGKIVGFFDSKIGRYVWVWLYTLADGNLRHILVQSHVAAPDANNFGVRAIRKLR